MIESCNLGKCYKDESGDNWVIRGMEVKIPKGRFTSIAGRSGSGKSTLLKMMGGLLIPDQSKVLIAGTDIYGMTEKQMADYRCNKIGFIFQDFLLEEMYTVYQNIEIVLMISKFPQKLRKNMVEQALEAVGLGGRMRSCVKNLSGGEKQRVCIARAIVNQPEIIFADEPCGNLDWENGQVIMKLLRDQVDQGRNVVLVTHNREDAKLTDEIITLQDGKILDYATL
jgi:ABC-type antimicrobial peptide transport system, ATPase component